MTEPEPDMIERAARAICRRHGVNPDDEIVMHIHGDGLYAPPTGQERAHRWQLFVGDVNAVLVEFEAAAPSPRHASEGGESPND